MRKNKLGVIAVSIAAILWGVDQIIIRPKLFHIENIPAIVFLEHLVGFIIMSSFAWYGLREIKKLRKTDWISFFWVSLFGGAIGTMAIVKALILVQFNNLSIVALLQKLQPIFAIIIARILLKEKSKKNFYMWAAFAVIGSYFVTFGFHRPDFTGQIFWSAVYAIIAAFAFGTSTSFGKRALRKVSFRTGAYIRFGLTTIIMAIIILFTGGASLFSNVIATDFLWFVFIAFTSGGLAMLVYYYGLKRIPASIATICELFYPLTAIILDFLINKNVLSIGQWTGAGILVFSIYRITKQ